MRGGSYSQTAMELPYDTTSQIAGGMSDMPGYVNSPGDSSDNMENNLRYAVNPGSLYWLLLMALLYAFWGWWDNREGVTSSMKPGELKVNLINLTKISLGVVIGINFINVFLTKLALLRIPVISRIAGTFLPLFSL